MTSRWALEVSGVRGFEIDWHPFSLKILNEGRDVGSHAAAQDRSLRAMRVIEQARTEDRERVTEQEAVPQPREAQDRARAEQQAR